MSCNKTPCWCQRNAFPSIEKARFSLENWLLVGTVNSSYFITMQVCSLLYFHPESVGVLFLQNLFKACAYLWRNKGKWVCSSLLLFAVRQIASENTRTALQRHISVLYMNVCKCACVCGYHMYLACLLPHVADFFPLPAFSAPFYTNLSCQWCRRGEEMCSMLWSVYNSVL